MKKIQTTQEIDSLKSDKLRVYLHNKMQALFDEYCVDAMDSIGCFVILEEDEFAKFLTETAEFVEVLSLDGETYLHGVNVLSEDCAEDIYLPIEVVEC